MKIIKENKFLIFDRPYNKFSYYRKLIRYFFKEKYYKFVLNMNVKKNFLKKKYYISICAIFKNEAIYLKEWIEYHRIIGIEHFYLYNNFSTDDYIDILKPYIDLKIVTLIDWPFKQGQMLAYLDCANKYADETNWIAYIDIDEFIVPNESDNLSDILIKFERKRPIIVAYWKLFGSSGLVSRSKDGLVIEDFYLCMPKYLNIGKFFYNTAYNYSGNLNINNSPHIHCTKSGFWKLLPVNFYDKVIADGINKVDDDIPPVQINHYYTKSFSEYINKVSRGSSFHAFNTHSFKSFYINDLKCVDVDYKIRKFLIKLKYSLNDMDINN